MKDFKNIDLLNKEADRIINSIKNLFEIDLTINPIFKNKNAQDMKQTQIGYYRKQSRTKFQYQNEIDDEKYIVVSDTENEPETPKKKHPTAKRKNPESDLFDNIYLPYTSRYAQSSSNQVADTEDLTLLLPPISSANTKQRSPLKPIESKKAKKTSTETEIQPNSRRSHLSRACKKRKYYF